MATIENISELKKKLIKFIEDNIYEMNGIPIVCNGGGLDLMVSDQDAEWLIRQINEREVEPIPKGEEYEDFQDFSDYDRFEFFRLMSTAVDGQPSNEIQIAIW